MRKILAKAAFTAALMFQTAVATAETLVIPTPDEAKGAFIRMFDDPGIAQALKNAHMVIGTCRKTSKASHAGEVACTVAVVFGAGSSETQANFYRERGQWAASPTKEDLPFPDPKLR